MSSALWNSMLNHLHDVSSVSVLAGRVQFRRVRSPVIGSTGMISTRFPKISMVGFVCPEI